MSKGIIVVDMPDKCCNCRMGFVNECYDQFECYFKPGAEIKPDERKPDWCPIRPIPEKIDRVSLGDMEYKRGWNDCLKEIMKGGDA